MGIAQKADFLLDDAFASGGSNGYDHKAMAITARGAWLSVQRHFLEMGVDVQKDAVRVVGCGDMSGDVFGNGLLLRSEEHTSELQSLMRISYAVFCLKQKNINPEIKRN